jgi:hypothetical protein
MDFSTLKMEVVISSEASGTTYETTMSNMPEDTLLPIFPITKANRLILCREIIDLSM